MSRTAVTQIEEQLEEDLWQASSDVLSYICLADRLIGGKCRFATSTFVTTQIWTSSRSLVRMACPLNLPVGE
jgi:hypothetical protein